MHTKSAIKWFERNGRDQSDMARALGVGKAAVSKWKKAGMIPPLHAARLEVLTGGELKFDPDRYPGPRLGPAPRRRVTIASSSQGNQ